MVKIIKTVWIYIPYDLLHNIKQTEWKMGNRSILSESKLFPNILFPEWNIS